MNKVDTITYQGAKDYATVPARLKQFREDNPRAVVETKPSFNEDGTIVFSARIVKDKAEENSAEATGHSYGPKTEKKAFEKLETVAVGRALALLGYLNDGQIATTEEMVEFEDYKQSQYEQAILDIRAAEKREEFAEILARLSPEQKKLATPIINERIQELKDAEASKRTTAVA